jgi:hypothetical protein
MKTASPRPSYSGHQPSTLNPQPKARLFCPLFAFIALLSTGCQILKYSSPTGERFTRASFASQTAIASLSVESTTNGIRRVELRGYTNDSSQALGTVTDAAVRAAIQSAR